MSEQLTDASGVAAIIWDQKLSARHWPCPCGTVGIGCRWS